MNYSIITWKRKIGVLWKTFKWFIFTLIVGLSPIIIPWTLSYVIPSDITFEKIVMEGTLLFFSATIVASLLIDYWQSQDSIDIKSWSGIFYVVMPICIIGGCIILFALNFERTEQVISFDFTVAIQIFLLFASFIYAIGIKFSIFTYQQMLYDSYSLRSSKLVRVMTYFSIQ